MLYHLNATDFNDISSIKYILYSVNRLGARQEIYANSIQRK